MLNRHPDWRVPASCVRVDEDEMRRAQGFDYLFKVVVIGDSGVGKVMLAHQVRGG